MVEALSRVGVDAILVTTDADGPDRLPVEVQTVTSYRGARTVFFRRWPGESLKPSPAMARWLDRTVREFDLVHIHSVFSYPSLVAGAAARRMGVPYVVRSLGQLDRWSLSRHPVRKRLFLGLGGRRFLEESAAMHWTDEAERENAGAFAAGRPGFVIPLGVDEELFGASAPAGGRSRVVLFLSRLDPKKNVEELIEAFLMTGASGGGWKLVVAGEGELGYVRSLRRRFSSSEESGAVEFVGWLSGYEKTRALTSAGLLALPSRQENFGIAVAEAMATGTPVLVSEAVALSRAVSRAGAGWVAPPGLNGLRDALIEAMGSSEERERRGCAARALAESAFRWESVAGQLAAEYHRILANEAT